MTRHEPGPLLHAYCHRCEKWRVLEADALTVDFTVDLDPPAEALCPDCGEYGLVKVRLPATRRPEAALLVLEHPPEMLGLVP
ncbi:MAG TPA: hypothetical protein VFP48_06440 [Steroidobacteraceae bacterium]|nr:hypothetical protein [Steroidobacteraceae bacterium]